MLARHMALSGSSGRVAQCRLEALGEIGTRDRKPKMHLQVDCTTSRDSRFKPMVQNGWKVKATAPMVHVYDLGIENVDIRLCTDSCGVIATAARGPTSTTTLEVPLSPSFHHVFRDGSSVLNGHKGTWRQPLESKSENVLVAILL